MTQALTEYDIKRFHEMRNKFYRFDEELNGGYEKEPLDIDEQEELIYMVNELLGSRR